MQNQTQNQIPTEGQNISEKCEYPDCNEAKMYVKIKDEFGSYFYCKKHFDQSAIKESDKDVIVL